MSVLFGRLGGIAVLAAVTVWGAGPATAERSATYTIGPSVNVSNACKVQNAEVEQAVDVRLGYVYEMWMGCKGIGFARSTNGGKSFGAPVSLPGPGSTNSPWDPALAVGPTGTVYASFMVNSGGKTFPIVDASTDHGAAFKHVGSLIPSVSANWGDRDFITAAPDGSLDVTWDYGPSAAAVTFICSPTGSCSFATGDLNAVVQRSTDGGRTWSAMTDISPGFPNSGADSAPILVQPNGVLDVVYQGYDVTDVPKDVLGVAYTYFSTSSDHGKTWSVPVKVGAAAGSMNTSEWWIDGALSTDAAGNLYATWDTQGKNADGTANDIGWLSYSTDKGTAWSAPVQVPADTANVPHVTQSVAVSPGIVDVGWLSDNSSHGYAQYIRTFSIGGGWQSAPTQVSSGFGAAGVWPGDTFGISALSASQLVLSWGSAVAPSSRSDIYAATVGVNLR